MRKISKKQVILLPKYSFSILVKLGKALKVPGKGKVLIPGSTANTLHCWANLYLRKNNKF